MNGAEVVTDPKLWIQIGTTVGSVFATFYVGFVKLSSKVDSLKAANDLAHEHIIKSIEKQNGSIDRQRNDMEAQKIVCAARHGSDKGDRG